MIQLRPHQARIVETMKRQEKGQIIVPTGGGKTLCMIKDAEREINSCNWGLINKQCDRKTIVVVAPRILLTQQLCEDFVSTLNVHPMLQYKVLHVHSGYTSYDSTTDCNAIGNWCDTNYRYNKLIFTTYHSLIRVMQSKIDVDTIYFDEAHNACQKQFAAGVVFFGAYSKRAYFFTATPKHATNKYKLGMNDHYVFGEVIINIPAPELVAADYILPPKVKVTQLNKRDKDKPEREYYEHDADVILSHLKDHNVKKLLICARKTSQITGIISNSKLCAVLNVMGYSCLSITSKNGAFIDNKKVHRETFFKTLNKWGKDDEKKFIVMHHSILSEGINVSGLEAALFLRNMNYITISQTIGRVIRKGNSNKIYGLICVPVYDKVGITTAKKVNAVVNTIFNKGEPAISCATR